MGVSFLIVIFTGMIIVPMMWGSFMIAQDADARTLNTWFGLAVLAFLGVALLGAGFLFLMPV